MANLTTEKTLTTNRCECYKKLKYIGIPLYKSDEEEEYGESRENILYENCFELPGILKINPKVIHYPIVNEYNLVDTFREMALVIPNLHDFEQNVLSFWIMDMFVEGLWTAQREGMHHMHQKATLLWIAYFFNHIQRNNPTRKELFQHLKKILFGLEKGGEEYSGEESVGGFGDIFDEVNTCMSNEDEGDIVIPENVYELPLPPGTKESNLETDTTASESLSENQEEEDERDIPTPSNSSEEKNSSERNSKHMQIILEILYRIFARLGVYLEMQAVLHHMPLLERVNLPFSAHVPKPAPKIDPFELADEENAMNMSLTSEGLINKLQMERLLHRNDFILPLQAAMESKAYIKQVFPGTASEDSFMGKGKERRKSTQS